MNQLIFASHNKDKLEEFRGILSLCPPYIKDEIEIISQEEAGIQEDAEETGITFAANSYIKAKAVYDVTGKPVFADDSGLEVTALNGAPGIYTARFAPKGQGIAAILEALKDFPREKRYADYVCNICYIDKEGCPHHFEDRMYGWIGFEPAGQFGCAFDPIFYIGDKSVAEYPLESKNQWSHRARAFSKFEAYLREHPLS